MNELEPLTPFVLAEDVAIRYERGADPAASGVNVRLESGKGLLVTGERGSGMTSLLRGVLGLVGYDGTLEVFGGLPGGRGTVGRVGYGPQGWAFPPGLSARSVLALITRQRGLEDPEPDALLERVAMKSPKAIASRLEVEDARRLSLACALAGDPDLLVLDDPWEFAETHAEIAAALARGAACLCTSHDPGGLPALLGATITLKTVDA